MMLMGGEPFAGLMGIVILSVKAAPLLLLLAGVAGFWLTVGGGRRSRWAKWLFNMPAARNEAPDAPHAVECAREARRR